VCVPCHTPAKRFLPFYAQEAKHSLCLPARRKNASRAFTMGTPYKLAPVQVKRARIVPRHAVAPTANISTNISRRTATIFFSPSGSRESEANPVPWLCGINRRLMSPPSERKSKWFMGGSSCDKAFGFAHELRRKTVYAYSTKVALRGRKGIQVELGFFVRLNTSARPLPVMLPWPHSRGRPIDAQGNP
jgi:hypothetical protein